MVIIEKNTKLVGEIQEMFSGMLDLLSK